MSYIDDLDRECEQLIIKREYWIGCFDLLQKLQSYQVIEAEMLLDNISKYDDLFLIREKLHNSKTTEEFSNLMDNYLEQKIEFEFYYSKIQLFFSSLYP